MKKQNLASFIMLMVFSLFFLSACLKDKCTRTYTSYTPVYKTKNEVRANVKSNAPQPVAEAGKLFIKGNYIFLNERNKGIHVIDNTDPVHPKNVSFIDIPGNLDMAVRGNTLYADLYSDLLVIDITNPTKAVVKKVLANSFPYRMYATGFIGDTSRIITGWKREDISVSCTQQYNPPCANCGIAFYSSGSADASKALAPAEMGGSMARFTIAGSTLYTVSDQDLNAFSIEDPENPLFTNRKNIGWGIETIYPFQDKLFIGSSTGMFIFSITNPGSPALLSQFSHIRKCDPVIADDEHAFVTLRDGTNCGTGTSVNQLDILDIKNISAPFILKSYSFTNPHGLSKDGDLLFVCDGRDGLKIYDASDVYDLKLKKHFPGFESYDVIAFRKLAIVVEKTGIRQYDYSNPAAITLLSKFNWK